MKDIFDLTKELSRYLGTDRECASAYRLENYCGCYESLADWAEEYLESIVELEDTIKRYFDYDSYASDCDLGGDIFTIEEGSKLHIFLNR